MKFGTVNPACTDAYRANTHANPPVVLRRKRCACGKVVTAKQLTQQGGCDTCARSRPSQPVQEAA